MYKFFFCLFRRSRYFGLQVFVELGFSVPVFLPRSAHRLGIVFFCWEFFHVLLFFVQQRLLCPLNHRRVTTHWRPLQLLLLPLVGMLRPMKIKSRGCRSILQIDIKVGKVTVDDFVTVIFFGQAIGQQSQNSVHSSCGSPRTEDESNVLWFPR